LPPLTVLLAVSIACVPVLAQTKGGDSTARAAEHPHLAGIMAVRPAITMVADPAHLQDCGIVPATEAALRERMVAIPFRAGLPVEGQWETPLGGRVTSAGGAVPGRATRWVSESARTDPAMPTLAFSVQAVAVSDESGRPGACAHSLRLELFVPTLGGAMLRANGARYERDVSVWSDETTSLGRPGRGGETLLARATQSLEAFSADWRSAMEAVRRAGAGAASAAPPQPRPSGATAKSVVTACPYAFTGIAAPRTCSCTAQASAAGVVWGADVYTDDSSVCRAALHAGVIGPGGGIVTVAPAPGRDAYPGTVRNGVNSSSFGVWGSSFRFTTPVQPADAATSRPAAGVKGQ
jgi:hypothetical protein